MKKFFYSLLVVGLVVIIALIFIPSKSKNVVRIGYIPVTHCIPLYIAQEKKFFEDEGLKVELVSLPGGPKILEALISGDIEIGFSNIVSILLANSNGNRVIPITGGPLESSSNKDHAIMVLKDSDIINPNQLKNKKIAINQRQNIDHLMIELYLDKYSVPIEDVEIVEVPFPRMLGVLESKTVDAIATAEPFVTLGLESGNARILDWNYVAVRKETFVSTYAVTDNVYTNNKSLIKGFQNAIKRATEIANNDERVVREVLKKYTSLTDVVIEKVMLPRFVEKIDMPNIQKTDSLLVNKKFISQFVKIKSLLEEK